MTFAHKGITLKAIPYLDNPFETPQVADAQPTDSKGNSAEPQPVNLSEATTVRLRAIENLMLKAPSLKPIASLGTSSFGVAGIESAAEPADSPH